MPIELLWLLGCLMLAELFSGIELRLNCFSGIDSLCESHFPGISSMKDLARIVYFAAKTKGFTS